MWVAVYGTSVAEHSEIECSQKVCSTSVGERAMAVLDIASVHVHEVDSVRAVRESS